MTRNFLKFTGILFLSLSILIYFLPDSCPHGWYDKSCFINWTNYIHHFGIGHVYKLEIDYLPLINYFLWAYAKLMGSTSEIVSNFKYLKIACLFGDILSIFIIFKFVFHYFKESHKCYFMVSLFLLNAAYFYNSYFYGQLDGLLSLFLLASFILAIKKQLLSSMILFVLAVNLKLQGVFLAPCLIIIWSNYIIKSKQYTKLFFSIMAAFVLQIFILIPFIIKEQFSNVMFAATSSVGRYPATSMGAYNIWYFIIENPFIVNDNFGNGISYNSYGLFMFLSAASITFFNPIKSFIISIMEKKYKIELHLEKLMLIAALSFFCFFYFNTQMHARYIHPAMVFLGLYALFTFKIMPFALISIAYFLNIEGSSKIFKGDILEFTVFWFNPVFVSSLFLLVFIYSVYLLFSKPVHKELIL
jgi:Gpi18-like mannosyltransferase